MVCRSGSSGYRTIVTGVDAILEGDISWRHHNPLSHRCSSKKKKNSFWKYRYFYRSLRRYSLGSKSDSRSLCYLNGLRFTI